MCDLAKSPQHETYAECRPAVIVIDSTAVGEIHTDYMLLSVAFSDFIHNNNQTKALNDI